MGAFISLHLRRTKKNKSPHDREIPQGMTQKSISYFVAPINHGRVIKVYDGDTITVAAYLPYDKSPLYKFSVRISGIDCPEMRTQNPDEKKIAVIARDTLYKKIFGKIVYLENVANDKYGRILADVMYEGHSCGDLLIESRLAVPYDGGTKISPDNWVKYYEGTQPHPTYHTFIP